MKVPNTYPVFLIIGGADIVQSPFIYKKGILIQLGDHIIHRVEKFWNHFWHLDPYPNSIWMKKLGKFLKLNTGKKSTVVTFKWSGSALPSKSREAIDTLRKQLIYTSKKYPGRPLIAICKSLSGPYFLRMLHKEPTINIEQMITLGSPWGLRDSVPDNVGNITMIESQGDTFYKVGNWLLFLNFWSKTPERKLNSHLPEVINVLLQKPSHGNLSHNATTGNIIPIGQDIIPLSWFGQRKVYNLINCIAQERYIDYRFSVLFQKLQRKIFGNIFPKEEKFNRRISKPEEN